MDSETLERQVLAPYRSGEPITINGTTITWDDVERVRVSVTDEPSAQIISRLQAEDRNSPVAVLGGPGYSWRAAARARDVTDQFITGPPGRLVGESTMRADEPAEGVRPKDGSEDLPNTRSVFLVAGRNSKANGAVTAFLRALGLDVVEWEHAVAKTGLPNPYVGDVVETGLNLAAAAVVLLTPDDLVQLRGDLLRDDDGAEERELRGQARPNVYYEAGIADTLGRHRTVIMEIGEVKSFSDAAGRHVVRYDGSPAKRHALSERLRVAGLNINTSGQDWLTAGDVEPVIAETRTALEAGTIGAAAIPVNKDDLLQQIDELLQMHEQLLARSRYDDLSDLPQDSMQLVFRAQALVDRFASATPYAAEASKVENEPVHVRLPVLVTVLQSLRAEAT